MAKYVKLGKNASSFYDPTTGLKIANKQVLEIKNDVATSKRVSKALKTGHLEWADEKDFNKYQKSLQPVGAKINSDKKEEAEVEFTEVGLMKLKKADLVALAGKEGSDKEQSELEDMNKSELVEHILELREEDEDDDEDDDDEDEDDQ